MNKKPLTLFSALWNKKALFAFLMSHKFEEKYFRAINQLTLDFIIVRLLKFHSAPCQTR